VGDMLRALDASKLSPITKAATELMLLTGVRDHALRAAQWSEIDLHKKLWTLPHARRKNRRSTTNAFVIPLSARACEVLKTIKPLTHKGPDSYVFASWGKEGYLAENTIRLALHDLGFEVTAHGFRSLMRDLLAEHGFVREVVRRQLDQGIGDSIDQAYLRTDFMAQRKSMLEWLGSWVMAQRNGSEAPELPGNVVTMRSAA
jgi:integrase